MDHEIEISQGDEKSGEGMGRLLALTDGVTAIAITLLVLNLTVNPAENLHLALRDQAPRFWGAALSFAVIGRYWLFHRSMFTRIERADELLAWLNLLFLAPIIAMPFSTELLTDYKDNSLSVMIYAGTVGAAALMGTVIWCYASIGGRLLHAGLMRSEDAPAIVANSLAGGTSAAVFFLISIPVALASPRAAELTWIGAAFPTRLLTPRLHGLAGRILSGGKKEPGARARSGAGARDGAGSPEGAHSDGPAGPGRD